MSDDQPATPDERKPAGASFTPAYENDPPTKPSSAVPTWAWVIITIVMVIVGLPLLAMAALFLFCLLSGPMRF